MNDDDRQPRPDAIERFDRLARRLPAALRPLLSLLSGIALPGRPRPIPWTPARQMGVQLAVLLVAATLGLHATQRLYDAGHADFTHASRSQS
jgi:hypothetical protein